MGFIMDKNGSDIKKMILRISTVHTEYFQTEAPLCKNNYHILYQSLYTMFPRIKLCVYVHACACAYACMCVCVWLGTGGS